MAAVEINFDGIVGPTHNYAGLSAGNIASMTHRGARSNPRAAALEGLAKMQHLAELGVAQAVLPPHPRPDVDALRRFGFSGNDAAVLRRAARDAPELLRACASASSMWVANAATVTPSTDAADGRVHFTPANLISKLHRSIEPPQTARILRAIFRATERFVIHEPVPAAQGCGDEGAANHTRLAPTHSARGLHLFVYGHHAFAGNAARPRRFASRQSVEASAAIARCHLIDDKRVVLAPQHPEAIDAGVFHNDVISVGNENVFFFHEAAFTRTDSVLRELRRRFARLNRGAELLLVRVPSRRISLADAVRSYLFNSQLVTLPSGGMALLAPVESRDTPRVRDFLEELISARQTPIERVHYVDLRQSMRNGGGPACLRLRVVLSAAERAELPDGIELTAALYPRLTVWAKKHYREDLRSADLADPDLLEESRRALDELTRILGLGSIYPFQQVFAARKPK